MNLEILLKDYCQYNEWANSRMIEWLKNKAMDVMETPVASSFPSLRASLLHIWAAEDIWLNRLKGMSPNTLLSESFEGLNVQIFEHLLQNSALFANFVQRQSDDFFINTCVYKHTGGRNFEQYNSEIILHCMQHSTYHRGQIVTIARQVGLKDPPKNDYIEYCRNKQLEL